MSKKSENFPEKRYEVAKIAGAHGVKGDMLLLPQTDFPARLLKMREMALNLPGRARRAYKVRCVRPYEGHNTFFLHLEGVEDRDAAQALRGAVVTVAEDERVELEEGEYWLDDIIGLKVLDDATEKVIGEVTEVIFTGSNDVYVVKTDEGLKAIPAVADVIKNVDAGRGTMTVTIPEGL